MQGVAMKGMINIPGVHQEIAPPAVFLAARDAKSSHGATGGVAGDLMPFMGQGA